MTDFTDIAWNNIHELEKNVIKTVFPEARFSQSQIFCNPEKPVNSFTADLSSSNLFTNTPYEYPGSGNFLHFTSLPVLSQILKSGFLRMSDFNCLSDKSEINFAIQNIKTDLSHYETKSKKDKLFCLSACESTEETILNKHMWEKYADKGRGCCIEYKFTSMDIFNMSFGKIQYGIRNLKPLNHLQNLLHKYSNENEGFTIYNIIEFLTPIFAFHKDVKYKKENEVRLFYYQNGSIGNDEPHLNQYSDFYRSDQVRSFIKIYLKGNNPYQANDNLTEKEVLMYSPQIEITKITLGPNIIELYDVIQQLSQLKADTKQNFEIWKITDNLEHYKLNI